MLQVRFWLLFFPLLCLGQTNVTIDGTGSGKTFQGVGAISGGGGDSRLLIDYPAQQQSEIFDYLFKPNYGAALQHLTVEIGGDMLSGMGAEASHERSSGVINCNRGYEWTVMQNAVSRSPSIVLDGLMWGTSGWVSTFFSSNNITYLQDWLGCASGKSLTVSHVGIWNETAYDTAWIKSLHTSLVSAGSSASIEAADQFGSSEWQIATDAKNDAALSTAIAVFGAHYPTSHGGSYPTADALSSGKQLWASEDGPWLETWAGAQNIAKIINRNYISGSIVKTVIWNAASALFQVFPSYNTAGLLLAAQPWSGNYTITPPIWAVAHTTQFCPVGSQYLDSASGLLSSGTTGSYVSMKYANGTDYCVVIETTGAGGNQVFNFTVQGGLSTGTVHVWKSTSGTQFIQQSDIVPSGGTYSLTAAADAIYSLTTSTGQAKGSASPPASRAFPLPYSNDFETYNATSLLPQYFSDLVGAFEVTDCTHGHSGKCLRQVLGQAPIRWPSEPANIPFSIVGNPLWSDYTVATDFMLEQAGTALLAGRIGSISDAVADCVLGYQLHFTDTGAWSLTTGNALSSLASGTATIGTNTWHRAKLYLSGSTITAYLDGAQLASVNDSTYATGLVGVGTQAFTNAQFDNFSVSVGGSAYSGKITIGGPVAGN